MSKIKNRDNFMKKTIYSFTKRIKNKNIINYTILETTKTTILYK